MKLMKDIKRYRVHHKKCNVYEHKSKKPFGNTLSHRARDEAHTEARKQMQTDKNGARKARINTWRYTIQTSRPYKQHN